MLFVIARTLSFQKWATYQADLPTFFFFFILLILQKLVGAVQVYRPLLLRPGAFGINENTPIHG